MSWRHQKHQCLCFHYWDYLTNFWHNNWWSIIVIVEKLDFWDLTKSTLAWSKCLKNIRAYLLIGQFETLILKTLQKVSNVTFKKDQRPTYIFCILNILKFKVRYRKIKCFYFSFLTGNVESKGFFYLKICLRNLLKCIFNKFPIRKLHKLSTCMQ